MGAGCDYLSSIAKIGITTAHNLLMKFRSIDSVIENLDPAKYTVPEDWNYKGARDCFLRPDVGDLATIPLVLGNSNVVALRELLVDKFAVNSSYADALLKRLEIVNGEARITRRPQRALRTHVGSIATPARSQERTACGTGPAPGQVTLGSIFAKQARAAPNLSEGEEALRKKRRCAAVQVIESKLGSGTVPTTASLEDVEQLAAEWMTADQMHVNSVAVKSTPAGAADGEICFVLD